MPDSVFETPSIAATEENFWQRLHWSHCSFSGPVLSQRLSSVDTSRAFPQIDEIARHEARLGVTLPARLRRLYRQQNGGSRMHWNVPCPADFTQAVDGWVDVFGGYDDCNPLEDIVPLSDRIADYADVKDQPEDYPQGASRLVVLAQWYRHTLFLDYRVSDLPKVGYCDFDAQGDLRTGNWEGNCLWWEDFDTFFKDLRRRPEDVFDYDADAKKVIADARNSQTGPVSP